MSTYFTASDLTSIIDNGTIALEGTKGIGDGFAKILATIDMSYHITGQLQVQLNGDKAISTSYCFVTLEYTDREE